MPETARILPFPGSPKPLGLSPQEAAVEALAYLDVPLDQRSAELREKLARNADTLMAACSILKERAEVSPATVVAEASSLYNWLTEANSEVGIFDEKDYFIGETALLAGRSCRHLGRRDEAERWLDRADTAFRHTMNPAPLLANVAYARLTLRYETRRYDEVAELVPSLIRSFDRLGMSLEGVKARFLQCVSLKLCGRKQEAFEIARDLCANQVAINEPALLGQVLIEIGEYHTSEAEYGQAMVAYQNALPLLRQANRPIALANLKFAIGETFRKQDRLVPAVQAFREALLDCETLGMSTYVAYLHVLIGEALLVLGKHREAEWQILAALPTIEEQKMVPEGFAAVALLKESVRRCKTDPSALRELREHLQAKN